VNFQFKNGILDYISIKNTLNFSFLTYSSITFRNFYFERQHNPNPKAPSREGATVFSHYLIVPKFESCIVAVFDASLADAHTKSSITNLKGPLAILLSSQRSEKKSKPAPSKSGKSPKSSKSPASDMGLSRLMLPRTFHSSLVNTRSHGGPAIPENLNQSAADDDTNKSPREKVISAFRTKTTDLHKVQTSSLWFYCAPLSPYYCKS